MLPVVPESPKSFFIESSKTSTNLFSGFLHKFWSCFFFYNTEHFSVCVFREKYVDLMVDQLEAMEDNFSRCDDQTSLKIILHKMEVQRLAYMTNEYIRERLKKATFYFEFEFGL